MNKSIDLYEYRRRLSLLGARATQTDREKLVYEWVKSGKVGFAEFKELVKKLNDRDGLL